MDGMRSKLRGETQLISASLSKLGTRAELVAIGGRKIAMHRASEERPHEEA